ncbi:MAG: hypothetical protein ACOZAG_00715, partial [Patescibacteria group bacterium]
MKKFFILIVFSLLIGAGCGAPEESPSRESKIPLDAVKITPETDINPVKSLSSEYEQPIPLPAPINTAGAEDSPFILSDGQTLYFFFTPDVRIPAEKQVIDNVTGIYISKKSGNVWSKPEHILLKKSGT